ncbi:FkbM family methyltransferase [Ectothiorhodospira sp. BSL-9]|uniref:FkbM family methyltransferase n=1 Tax=Ectothiorhodospira sp. BSL-9 TaxID=1442136 RepID=UPI0007B43338|nr:FkbM family methyltransferase [Ectothiorhodospira sp. BSL-9]ANB02012.1 FkbM family methyltransferase [Ectothiorhodospira sp. BSL-9]
MTTRVRRWLGQGAAGLGLSRSLVIYWRPGRQRGLRRMYEPFVQPGDLVFDVGAHVGDRTLAFAALGARVVAVEPQPLPLAWLKRLTRHRPAIQLEAVALDARPGSAWLAISRLHPTVSTLAEAWRQALPERHPGFQRVRWEDGIMVPVTTLDELIARHGVPAFCKIDVEGHEAQVLAGLSQPLPALSVEFIQGALAQAVECIDRLEGLATYEYNVVTGEQRRFLWPQWRSATALHQWLHAGAAGIASGDLYARRTHPPAGPEAGIACASGGLNHG